MKILNAYKLPDDLRNIKLFLNGKDITKNAFWAIVPSTPDRTGLGIVRIYKRNKDGQKYFDRQINAAAQTVRGGLVRWMPNNDQPTN